MRKALLPLSALVLSVSVFSSCTKESNKVFNTNFYTSESGTAMFLYVDDVYQGKLTYFSAVPGCGVNNSDGPKALNMTLNSGEHRVIGKDAQGKIVSSSVVKLRAETKATSGNIGGLRLDDNGSCVTIGLSR